MSGIFRNYRVAKFISLVVTLFMLHACGSSSSSKNDADIKKVPSSERDQARETFMSLDIEFTERCDDDDEEYEDSDTFEFNVNYVNKYVQLVDYPESNGDLFRLSKKDGKFSFGFEVDSDGELWTGVIEYTVDPTDNSVTGTLKNGKTKGDGWSCELLHTKVSGYTYKGPDEFGDVADSDSVVGLGEFIIETNQGNFEVINPKARLARKGGTDGVWVTGGVSSTLLDFDGEIEIAFMKVPGKYNCNGTNSHIKVTEEGEVAYQADTSKGSGVCDLDIILEQSYVKGSFTAMFDEALGYEYVKVTKAEFNLPLN